MPEETTATQPRTKKYIKGSARQGMYNSINCSISISELQDLANDKGYVDFVVTPKKDIDQFGNTHAVYHLNN